MTPKPFNKTPPPQHADPTLKAGWEAEKDAAFRLDRAFGDPARREVRVFHDLRLPATYASGNLSEGDFFQIDHLVLHRHGMALVESKSVAGELHVDQLGQWQRRSAGHTANISSPVTQVQQQAAALKRLCQSSAATLLNKVLGVAQAGFGAFPATPFVAIASRGRFTGATGPYEQCVVKVDRIVESVQCEMDRHQRRAGLLGTIRAAMALDVSGAGAFNLSLDELDRIEQFLLRRHTPRVSLSNAPHPAPAEIRPPAVEAAATRGERVERLEAMSCSKCGSMRVRVVYARDYCLKCDDCGRFSSLPYVCPDCGKHATIRKRGPEHFRECDGDGGCGRETVFWRSPSVK